MEIRRIHCLMGNHRCLRDRLAEHASKPGIELGAGRDLPNTILGFPTWAFHAVVASVLYASFIACCLQRHGALSASGDDGEDEWFDDSSLR